MGHKSLFLSFLAGVYEFLLQFGKYKCHICIYILMPGLEQLSRLRLKISLPTQHQENNDKVASAPRHPCFLKAPAPAHRT